MGRVYYEAKRQTSSDAFLYRGDDVNRVFTSLLVSKVERREGRTLTELEIKTGGGSVQIKRRAVANARIIDEIIVSPEMARKVTRQRLSELRFRDQPIPLTVKVSKERHARPDLLYVLSAGQFLGVLTIDWRDDGDHH